MPRGRSKLLQPDVASSPQAELIAADSTSVGKATVANRSNRLLAEDNVENAGWQLSLAYYKLQIVGPNCAHHWLLAAKHIAVAEERIATAKECLRVALEEDGPELLAELAKIVTRRH